MISSRSPGRRIALVGAFVGLFASAYLLVDYVFGSGICLTGSGCDVVRSSAFAYPLGIPMPLLGLGFYLTAVVLLLVNPSRTVARVRADTAATGWSLIGLATMTILTIIELVVIGALCSWCLMSALGSLLLAAGTIAAWRRRDTPPEVAARSSRARRRSSTEAERSRHDLNRFALTSGALMGVALVALLAVPALTSGTPVDPADVGGEARPRLGDGPVEVVVFSDFQCPACAVAAPALTRLADEGSISLMYRYFPLTSIHPNAAPAAQAAEAATRQGSFWPFHDALFASQASWAELPAADAALAFQAIAEDLGLDLATWSADAASSSVADVVGEDQREAEQLSLPGTPTIFIDGARYDGQLTHADLLRAVRAAAGG